MLRAGRTAGERAIHVYVYVRGVGGAPCTARDGSGSLGMTRDGSGSARDVSWTLCESLANFRKLLCNFEG